MGFFDKIQETISSAADQTKAKAQETQLKKERRQKLEALGEQVCNLYRSGRLAHQELAPACQEVVDLDGRIEAAAEQFKAAQTQAAPAPVPGAPGPPPAQQPAAPQAPPPPPQEQQAGATPPPPPPPPPPESGQ